MRASFEPVDTRIPVSHIMTTDVVALQADAPVSTARHALLEYPFHHVPVVRGRKLVGMLSVTDLTSISLAGWVGDSRTVDAWLDERYRIDEVMTHEPVTVRPDDTVHRAAELLAEGQFHALPVIDDHGALVGMLTTTDLIRLLAALLT